MFTSSISGGMSGTRFSSFFYSNGKELQNSFVKLASGKSISAPSDGVGDYFRSEDYSAKKKEYNKVTRKIAEGIAVIDYAEQANRMIWDDLESMKLLAKDYYKAGVTADEQAVIISEFEEIKTRIAKTQQGAVYDGKEVLSESSAAPLFSVSVNPHDLSQTFEVAFGADKVVDASGLDITAGEATFETALEEQVGRSAKYGAQLTGFRYGLNTQYRLAENTIDGNDESLRSILDVDEAKELFATTRRSIQQQAATSMFAQHGVNQGSVLQLVAGL